MFGLLLQSKLFPRTFKYRPIWSCCLCQRFRRNSTRRPAPPFKPVHTHEEMLNMIRPSPLPTENNVWLTIQMYGEIDKKLLRHILEIDTISPDGKNKTHFLVCSNTWATKIKELHAQYPLDGEIWTRIHTEVFQF